MGHLIKFPKLDPIEAPSLQGMNEVDAKISQGKNAHALAAEIEEFRLRMPEHPTTANQEGWQLLSSRVKQLSSQKDLTSSTRQVLRAAQKQLRHLHCEIEHPLLEDLDEEYPLPNFAQTLLALAEQVRKTKSIAALEEGLDAVQKREVFAHIPEGEVGAEDVARAIEGYLRSLQGQAAEAERLLHRGDEEGAQALFLTVERRMGMYE